MESRGDKGFSRASRRVEDDIASLEQFNNCGFLRGIEAERFCLGVFEESPEKHVGTYRSVFRQEFVKRHRNPSTGKLLASLAGAKLRLASALVMRVRIRRAPRVREAQIDG